MTKKKSYSEYLLIGPVPTSPENPHIGDIYPFPDLSNEEWHMVYLLD